MKNNTFPDLDSSVFERNKACISTLFGLSVLFEDTTWPCLLEILKDLSAPEAGKLLREMENNLVFRDGLKASLFFASTLLAPLSMEEYRHLQVVGAACVKSDGTLNDYQSFFLWLTYKDLNLSLKTFFLDEPLFKKTLSDNELMVQREKLEQRKILWQASDNWLWDNFVTMAEENACEIFFMDELEGLGMNWSIEPHMISSLLLNPRPKAALEDDPKVLRFPVAH